MIPNPNEFYSKSVIPNSFNTINQYQRCFISAIYGLLLLFCRLLLRCSSYALVFVDLIEELQFLLDKAVQAKHTRWYKNDNLELIVSGGNKNKKKFQKFKKWNKSKNWKKKKASEDEEEEEEEPEQEQETEPDEEVSKRYYLKILAGREHHAKYCRDDLWILSIENNRNPFFLRSLYHGICFLSVSLLLCFFLSLNLLSLGPSKEGWIELLPIEGCPLPSSLKGSQVRPFVFCLR
jgi:hypothetical protein